MSYNVLDDYVSPTGDDLYLAAATGDSTDVGVLPPGRHHHLPQHRDRRRHRHLGGVRHLRRGRADGGPADGGDRPGRFDHAGGLPVVHHARWSGPRRSPTRCAGWSARRPNRSPSAPFSPKPGSEAATARLDPLTGTVAITATAPGSYYLTFEASTGGRGVTGVLRADFVEPNESARSVVPMTDVAYLTPGGQTVLDPLANDTDPDGQGLAVREVDLPAGAPITAAVVDLHLVQVSAPANAARNRRLRLLGVRRGHHQGRADPRRAGAGAASASRRRWPRRSRRPSAPATRSPSRLPGSPPARTARR